MSAKLGFTIPLNYFGLGLSAVVTKDILESGITVAGVPARKVSNNDSRKFLARQLFDQEYNRHN